MLFAILLMQTAAPAAPASPGTSFFSGVIPVILMIAIVYFVLLMPMRRQQRNQKEMIKALQNGQTVVTSGGIIGTIVAVNDDTLVLRIKPDNLKIQVARSAVTSVVTTDDQSKK